ncbi:MAG: DNA repair protein RecO [Pyrinomonadaceae bacterium]
MALIETESLILKTYSLSEADKIVVFLTLDQGLVRGVAKGAKRLKSRFGGALEPFSVIDLTYFQKEERELVSVRQIELKKSYFGEASNPQFLQKFSYLAELLAEFAPPHEPNERMYRMTKVCLETASENLLRLEAIALYFEIWLLKLAGFLPVWDKCGNCHREFEESENAGLQINFHLLCRNCQKSKNGLTVSAGQRKFFTKAQKLSPAAFLALSSEQDDQVREVSVILKRIISHILGKENIGERILTAAS